MLFLSFGIRHYNLYFLLYINSRILGFRTKHAVGSQTNRWDSGLGVYRYPSGDSAQSKHATAALVHYSAMLGYVNSILLPAVSNFYL